MDSIHDFVHGADRDWSRDEHARRQDELQKLEPKEMAYYLSRLAKMEELRRLWGRHVSHHDLILALIDAWTEEDDSYESFRAYSKATIAAVETWNEELAARLWQRALQKQGNEHTVETVQARIDDLMSGALLASIHGAQELLEKGQEPKPPLGTLWARHATGSHHAEILLGSVAEGAIVTDGTAAFWCAEGSMEPLSCRIDLCSTLDELMEPGSAFDEVKLWRSGKNNWALALIRGTSMMVQAGTYHKSRGQTEVTVDAWIDAESAEDLEEICHAVVDELPGKRKKEVDFFGEKAQDLVLRARFAVDNMSKTGVVPHDVVDRFNRGIEVLLTKESPRLEGLSVKD